MADQRDVSARIRRLDRGPVPPPIAPPAPTPVMRCDCGEPWPCALHAAPMTTHDNDRLRKLIDVERSDYLFSPGRTGILQLGPFTFSVNTADGGSFAFDIDLGRWSWYWGLILVNTDVK